MKKLTIGIVIGLMLGISTNAFAAIGDRVTAVFSQFEYVVNGETKTLDEPVLVHEGNSYLRTTQISNMLGYDVTYKADSRTIEFNKPDPIVTPIVEPTVPTTTTGTTSEIVVTTEPTPIVTQEPTPAPDNTAVCKAIRDEYSAKIVLSFYEGGSEGQIRMRAHLLEYERDQALSAAGC